MLLLFFIHQFHTQWHSCTERPYLYTYLCCFRRSGFQNYLTIGINCDCDLQYTRSKLLLNFFLRSHHGLTDNSTAKRLHSLNFLCYLPWSGWIILTSGSFSGFSASSTIRKWVFLIYCSKNDWHLSCFEKPPTRDA